MRVPVLMLSVSSLLTVTAVASGAGNAPLRLHLPTRVVANRSVTVIVSAARAQPVAQLRIVAVAPNLSVMDVVLMRRVSPSSWKAEVAFPHSGRWHLVVPNWTLAGYTTPFPVDATVLVRP
jgi:hypothetical protein